MKKIFLFLLIICSFFLVSCTIVDDMNENSEEDNKHGEVEETPGEGETDNNSGSTGWLPWV